MALKATQTALTQSVLFPVTGGFSVIETGGKQYVVSDSTELRIEKIEAEAGTTITFDKVLLIVDDAGAVTVGTPYITGASISATVEAQGKGKKLRVIHFKSKSNRHKTYGHRQPFTAVTISTDNTEGKTAKPAVKKVAKKAVAKKA
jgi:large subunit ribosomal protein L21